MYQNKSSILVKTFICSLFFYILTSDDILERVHGVPGDILRTRELQTYTFHEIDSLSEILASVAWAICSTHHTTLHASQAQLVFGRDMLLNLQFTADWDVIRLRKQRVIDTDNTRKNSLRVDYGYQVGDQILVTSTDITRKLNCRTRGPFNFIQVYKNGTACVQNSAVSECVNIICCILYTV